MKASCLFALISLGIAAPKAGAATELEKLRVRCAEQESRIRSLEAENSKLRGQGNVAIASTTNAKATADAAYTVKKGESLELIARKNRCTVSKLASENGLKTDSVIHPGQKLKVPGASEEKRQDSSQETIKAKETSTKPLAGKSHKLVEGETYSSLAKKYKVSVNSLIAANPQASPTKLRGGQMIQIPGAASGDVKPSVPVEKTVPSVSETRVAKSQPTKPAAAPAVAQLKSSGKTIPISTETKPALLSKPDEPAPDISTADPAPESTPAPEKKIRPIKIEGEMTYGEFAVKHGTNTGRLNDLNGLDLTQATVLAKGSELYVPAQP